MSTLTSKSSLETKKYSQDKAKTQQLRTNTQYLNKHDAEKYLAQVLSEHKAVFEALKNR